MRVTIIGGAGQMGRVFARYFKSKGFSVTIQDKNLKEAERVASLLDVSAMDESRKAVEAADTTLISVPLGSTPYVILDVAPYVGRGKVLAEIASMKRETVEALRTVSGRGFKPLSIHPLFGPGVKSFSREKMAVIPVLSAEAEVEEARAIFPECRVFPVDVETHDLSMSMILYLPFLMNLGFAATITEGDVENLRMLAGPAFGLQLLMCESTLSQDPKLYFSILEQDGQARELIRLLVENMKRLSEARLEEEELEKFVEDLREKLGRESKLRESYEKMYRIWEILKG
ncbi:MAG: prephenate dehydrogenase/arogenate dehydrogenase family protein [Candidatus Geothermarchaeales archaeon]